MWRLGFGQEGRLQRERQDASGTASEDERSEGCKRKAAGKGGEDSEVICRSGEGEQCGHELPFTRSRP